MTRLFPAVTLTGATASLKSIDPLDCLGDGSGHLLVEGDRAVVFSHERMIVFYSLESRAGGNNQDIGFEEIVPASNPGDWYWKCRGFTKSTFTGGYPGEKFTQSYFGTDVSTYIPTGFTGDRVPYSESAIVPMGNYSTTDDYSWWVSAIWDNKTYVALNDGYYYIDHETGVGAYVLTDEPNGYDYYWNPGWDLCGNAETDKYMVDMQELSDEPTKLARFNLETLQHDAIDIIFPGDWAETWANEFPGETDMSCIKVEEWHYMWGGTSLKAFKINVLTGQMVRISNPDNEQCLEEGWWCVDYNNGIIYAGCGQAADYVERVYQYDIATDTWSRLPDNSEGTSYSWDSAWYDERGNQIVVINTYADYIAILDLTLGVWTNTPWGAVINWDNYWTSYSFQMKGIGCVEPFGWDYDTSSNELLDDLILPANNPVIFVKD